MIKVTAVQKKFGDCEVLKGIDLTVKKGEMLAIMGPSGAGKSTLLNLIGTLDLPDAGDILIDDQDISKLPDAKLSLFRNKNIGFIFQHYNLLYEFSAIENVCLPAYVSNTSNSKVIRRAKELLSLVELESRLHHKPSQLSGGEQQRVSIARALMNDPKIILADEPTGNLDSINTAIIYNLFTELSKVLSFTFIITTHNAELASNMHRIVTMKDGLLIS